MGCREHALTICDLLRLFRRINVPALPCTGATGAVSGLVLRKGNAYRIPVYPETHRKRNTPVSASGRQRLDRLRSDSPPTRDAEQASRRSMGALDKKYRRLEKFVLTIERESSIISSLERYGPLAQLVRATGS